MWLVSVIGNMNDVGTRINIIVPVVGDRLRVLAAVAI